MNLAQLHSMQVVRKHTEEEQKKRAAENANPTVAQTNKISLKKHTEAHISLKKDNKEAQQYVADLKRNTPKSPRKHNINYYNSEEYAGLLGDLHPRRNCVEDSIYIDGIIMTRQHYDELIEKGVIENPVKIPVPREYMYIEEQALPDELPNYNLVCCRKEVKEFLREDTDIDANANRELIETNSGLTEEEKELAAKVLAVDLNVPKKADDKEVVVANKNPLPTSNKELVETSKELTKEEKELAAKALSASYFGYY